jgi:hypothetical protein
VETTSRGPCGRTPSAPMDASGHELFLYRTGRILAKQQLSCTRGLTHRDVAKPNVIFVEGRPNLLCGFGSLGDDGPNGPSWGPKFVPPEGTSSGRLIFIAWESSLQMVTGADKPVSWCQMKDRRKAGGRSGFDSIASFATSTRATIGNG